MSEKKNEICLRNNEALGRCTILKAGLLLPQDMEFKEWESAGLLLRQLNQSLQFMLGDWLNYGEAVYGEAYAQALDETDYSLQTLRNYAYVCRKVQQSIRRPEIPFSLQRHVAPLEPEQQKEALDHAEGMLKAGGFTENDFRVYIKTAYGNGTGDSADGHPTMSQTLDEVKSVLAAISGLVSERTPSAIPSKEDIAWMLKTIKSVRKKCEETMKGY